MKKVIFYVLSIVLISCSDDKDDVIVDPYLGIGFHFVLLDSLKQ